MAGQNGVRQGHWWKLIGGCAIFTLGLGYIGFRDYFLGRNDPRPPLNLLYLSLQLFTLDSGSVAGHVPLTLDIARLAAPTLFFGAGVKLLLKLFSEEFDLWRIWVCFRNHVVICGLGEKALHYVQDFVKSRDKVVVIERNAENDHIKSARSAGAMVLVSDARNEKALKQARVDRAKLLIAVTGEDLANMEIAQGAKTIQRKSGALDCYIHTSNPDLFEAAKVHERLLERTDTFMPNLFSFYRHAAREMFNTTPMDRGGIPPDSPNHVHLIIFGFGTMGENVLLQAARIGHFANFKKLRVTLVDRFVDALWQRFFFRYPNIDKVCDRVDRICADAEHRRVIQSVQDIASEKNAVVSAVICFNSDERSLAYAVGLRERLENLNFPISIRMPQESLLCRTLDDAHPSYLDPPFSLADFGKCSKCCTSETLIGKARDAVAKEIQARYIRIQRGDKATAPSYSNKNRSDAEWEMLGEGFRGVRPSTGRPYPGQT